MAKTSFYNQNTVIEETESDLSEAPTPSIDNSGKAKSSFYSRNDEFESVSNLYALALLARLPIFLQNLIGDGELCCRFLMADDDITLDLSIASLASCITAPTSEAVFSIKKNGTEFGTLTFGAGETEGAFEGSTVFTAGDVLTIIAPSPADTTLADVSITLASQRVITDG